MADDLTPAASEGSSDQMSHSSSSPWGDEHVRSPHLDKFRLVLAALIGLAIGALAVAAAVVVAHDNGSGSSSSAVSPATSSIKWSSWKPTGTGNAGAAEIADYIAPFYRLTTSEQLAVITPIDPTELDASTGTFTGSGLTVALNESSGSNSESDLKALPGDTVAYDLCGQGNSKCAVAGTPSIVRELLLRREALELALYTLEYLPKSENIVVVLPPSEIVGAKQSKSIDVAVLFDRTQLESMLTEPINDTLQEYPPDVAELTTWKKTEEAGLVDTITSRNLFSESVESEQDEGTLLILNPLPAS